MIRQIWLGLLNTYSPWLQEIHFRRIARAAPLCYAFRMNLILINFPFKNEKDAISECVSNTTTWE